MYLKNEEILTEQIAPGVERKVLANSERLMCVELFCKKGAVGVMHQHPHEQVSYIISGSYEYHEEGKEPVILTAGDTYYAAPNVMHGVTALEDSHMIDVFTPKREEFVQRRKAETGETEGK